MSAAATALKYITPEEYLAMEENAAYKSEYYQGEIFAMAGSTFNHGRIVRNLSTKFTDSFQSKNCEVFSTDLRVRGESTDWFVYPDITVICGKLQPYKNRHDTIINPMLIVEVLSKSTADYDRGTKFLLYRSIPTLREYILIDQRKIHVEQFSLGADGKWVLTEYHHADDILRCTSVDFQISLREIYHHVEFENE